jgi:hypothetical protein
MRRDGLVCLQYAGRNGLVAGIWFSHAYGRPPVGRTNALVCLAFVDQIEPRLGLLIKDNARMHPAS